MVTPTVNPGSVFPADWTVIAVEGSPFQRDAMHFPFPISPLTASTVGAFERGYTAAMQELGLPVQAMQVRTVNHYRYERLVPRIPGSEREAAEQTAAAEKVVEHEIARMLDRWYIEDRPEIMRHHDRLRQIDLREASPEAALWLLDEIDAIHRDLWTIHFRIAVPMLVSMQVFTEFHTEVFGASAADAQTLMSGGLSESIKAAFGLAALATLARSLGLADLFATTPDEALMDALRAHDNGGKFLAELDAYLEEYGLRQDLFDLATPTWRERPVFALASVRNYLETGHDPHAEHEATVRLARMAFELTRTRMARFPAAVREQFETLVQHARQGAFLQEEHNFHIDQRGLALLRLAYQGVGRRFVDVGVLEAVDDVFMLRIDEIEGVLRDEVIGAPLGDLRDLVRTRREELERAAAMTPPPYIGDLASAPSAPDTPLSRAVLAFFGGPPQAAEVAGQLKGNPGSRGIASGSARIARTLEEAAAVRPGEVLVAVTTMPSWTPLFGVAAAVVTETGGALSHCAIVAREYGIPAVVGVADATRAIRTGQRVTVDGDRGIISIDG